MKGYEATALLALAGSIKTIQYIPTGPEGQVPVSATVERYQKAPNLVTNIY